MSIVTMTCSYILKYDLYTKKYNQLVDNHVKNSKSLSPKFSGVANRRSSRD